MAGDRKAKRGKNRVALWELAKAEQLRAMSDPSVQLALMPASDDQQPVAVAPGRGRPAGSVNVAPLEYQRYLIQMGGDVVLRATRIAMADTMELAAALGCDPLEAANLQAKYATIAAPYQRQELPKAVELVGDQWAGFMMLMGAADRQGNVDPALQAKAVDVLAALSGPAPKSEDLQGFGDTESVVSDTGHSDTPGEDGGK